MVSRSIRIVQRQHRALREQVRGAVARRMIGIAFNLRRTAFMALDQQARATPPSVIAVAKNSGLPGISSSGWRTYGTINSVGLHRARGHAGQRHRRAHQLQEVAAADRIEPLRRIAGNSRWRNSLNSAVSGNRRRGSATLAVRRPAASRVTPAEIDRDAHRARLIPCLICVICGADRVVRLWMSHLWPLIGGTPSNWSGVPGRRSCIARTSSGPSSACAFRRHDSPSS